MDKSRKGERVAIIGEGNRFLGKCGSINWISGELVGVEIDGYGWTIHALADIQPETNK